METEWTLCFVSVQIFYIDILFLRQGVAVFSDETPSPGAELMSWVCRKGRQAMGSCAASSKRHLIHSRHSPGTAKDPMSEVRPVWVNGNQAVTHWFVPRKAISNVDFLLKAWLLQVKHLWKLWTHEVHPLVSAPQTIEVQKPVSTRTKAKGFCLSVAMLSFIPVLSIWLHSNSGHFCPSYVTDFRNGFA